MIAVGRVKALLTCSKKKKGLPRDGLEDEKTGQGCPACKKGELKAGEKGVELKRAWATFGWRIHRSDSQSFLEVSIPKDARYLYGASKKK